MTVNRIFSLLKVKDEDRSLLVRTLFIFLCSGAMSTLTGAVLPDMQQSYALSYEFRGFLLSVQQAGNLSAVFLAGFLPYILGRKRCTVLLSSGIVLGIILMVSTGNPLLLVIAFLVSGMGRGTLSNTTNVVVTEVSGNSGAGLNLLHASFAVGAFISPFLAVYLGSAGWRTALLLTGGLMLLGIILIATSTLKNGREERTKGGKVPFMKDTGFWLVTFILFFYLCAEASLMGWMVTYFQESGVMSASLSKTMQSLLWIMILLGRLLCAMLTPRTENRMTIVVFLSLLFTAAFAVMMSSVKLFIVIPALLLTGFSMSGIYPTTLSSMDSRFNGSTVATGVCIGTATLGGILWPNVVGFTASGHGMKTALMTILLPLAVMDVLVLAKRLKK